jgi:hypothetical protein
LAAGAQSSGRSAPSVRVLSGRAVLRGLLGFVFALLFWFGFSRPYERTIAVAVQALTNVFESPDVTRLDPIGGQIRVDRRDFPPGSARPGLPMPDVHFNFVLLATLFALDPRPLSGPHLTRFLAAAASLWAVHVIAVAFEVQSLYATSLGAWSSANYGRFARNVWAGGWHFYQIAGRFAAPFALWWLFGRREEERAFERPRGSGKKKRRERARQ